MKINIRSIKGNIKNIIVTLSFMLFIIGIMIANFIKEDSEYSFSERRKLNTLPQYSTKKLFNGELFEAFEKYGLDQFIFRDDFRKIKALGSYYILNKKDNNNIYIVDGNINKIEYPLNEKSMQNAADKFKKIYNKYFKDNKVYYSVIPDKNYFIASKNGYLSMDYNKMIEILKENIDNMDYIDIFDLLDEDDYYKTDIHWRQEKIIDVALKLMKEMGNDAQFIESEYTSKELYPFYGSYYGQAAIEVIPDNLIYLTNKSLEDLTVYDYEGNKEIKVYSTDKFGDMDSYDVFLSGAKSILSISNPNSKTDKELVLFRDSFGSSIAPLLISEYSKITLIDIRYISSDILDKFIEFSPNQDVLFLYSSLILNNSYMFK